jgi:hypothetical protein
MQPHVLALVLGLMMIVAGLAWLIWIEEHLPF